MLALAWQYLTGRAVAADLSDRTEPEWPPHPDRVFQALVAAWGERGCEPDEKAALAWLEKQEPPDIVAPRVDDADGGSPGLALKAASPKVYVPVNDTAGAQRGAYVEKNLSLLPAHRARKERYFPARFVGDAVCALVWPDADGAPHRAALERLAGAVTYIGHSSSLVRAWFDESPPPPVWTPAGVGDVVDVRLRVPEAGRLEGLVRAFADGGAGWTRPTVGAWQSYGIVGAEEILAGAMSGRLIVLRRVAGVVLSLGQTLSLTMALRSVLLRHSVDGARVLLSGHAPGGEALTVPHAAYVPLSFVGAPYADGHLLGFGIVLPRDVTTTDETSVLAAIADALNRETDTLEIPLSDGRCCVFGLEGRIAPPMALRAATWAAAAKVWTTVTPIVLDRQPPRRHPDRDAFVRDELAGACERVGLPRPAEIAVSDVAWLEGVPPASGFPPLPNKLGINRRHVHARLRFASPVRGPVLLGAGRYRGLGLCKPLSREEAS